MLTPPKNSSLEVEMKMHQSHVLLDCVQPQIRIIG